MLTLILIVAVAGVTLAVFFYVGAMFLQGYIYTEPSQDLYWQAPAAAAVLTVFLVLWTLLIANTEGATKKNIPYDTLFRFSPRVDLLKEPAPKIVAVYKNAEKKPFKRERLGQTQWRYADTTVAPSRPWRYDGVEAVEVEIDGETQTFQRIKGTGGAYDEFVSDKGPVMKGYDSGPDGTPSLFRWGRFITNLFLNFLHFLIWWLCLWLILRFQWSHALGLGFVLWAVFTLSLLPMLFEQAAQVAESHAAPPGLRSEARIPR